MIWNCRFENLALNNQIPSKDIVLKITPLIGKPKSCKVEIKLANGSFELISLFTEEDQNASLEDASMMIDEYTIKEYLFELISNKYFANQRTALDIYLKYKTKFNDKQHPKNLIRVLLDLCDGRKNRILYNNKFNTHGRQVFYIPINFNIENNKGVISKAFSSIGITSFQEAAQWVKELPYRRNIDKNSELAIFDEQCGTCSTKHALLKRLADENGNQEFRLMLGIYTMNAKNTPAIKDVLKKYKLKYIPEAHNYFRAYNYILDYTGIGINETKFELDILHEIEIQPEQITDFKMSYHKEYLWKIREECIEAIAKEEKK